MRRFDIDFPQQDSNGFYYFVAQILLVLQILQPV